MEEEELRRRGDRIGSVLKLVRNVQRIGKKIRKPIVQAIAVMTTLR
jgi:hypothetical protein